jgi:phosphatidylglycerophosphatase A
VRRAVLSLFGIGFVPGLPGTYASAATAAGCLGVAAAGVPLWVAAAGAVVLGTLATLAFAAPRDEDRGGDPPWVVTDEVAGQGLATLGAVAASSTALAVAVAFALFRVLDIGKPGPVGALERLPGALGVLADDLAAGLGAGAATLGIAAATGL